MDPFWAHGTVVDIGSFPIGGLTGITLPDRQRGEVETTHAGSGGTKSFIAGLRNGGSLQLQGRKIPGDAGQESLIDNWEANGDSAIQTITITFPETNGAISFDGFVTAFGGSAPQASDEAATFTCTIKVASGITESP